MRRNSSTTIFNFYNSRVLLLVLCFAFPFMNYAQSEKKHLKTGNEAYKKSDYVAAEKEYNKALGKNKDSYKATFNLGDAYYKQGKYEEAANQFQLLTHRATSKDTLAKAFHNLGNSLLKSKKYQESVDAYKNALKNNPNDADTRYNLAYAQQYLKQQQEQQKKEQEKKDKEKKDEKKDKNKDKEEKEKKEKEEKEKDNKENKDKKEKPEEQKNKISKEDAQRLLDALQNDEKNLQDKMKKIKGKGVKVEIEKDW